MILDDQVKDFLIGKGADFLYFVNISRLSKKQNKKFPSAIILGIVLSPEYLQKLTETPDYVERLIKNKQVDNDEFNLKEHLTDHLADLLADFLISKGYNAFSQSESNLIQNHDYNEKTKSTPLPHKIIAVLAGMGWIGNHNLLVNPEYGSAISMCTVLTNAPLKTFFNEPVGSLCSNCDICKNICPTGAIKGNKWNINTKREDLINVYKCTTCLNCLVLCPWTQVYIKKSV